MKKLYTLFGAALMVGSINAQVYFGKDFQDKSVTSGGCTIKTVVGSYDWSYGAANCNAYGKISNYSNGNTASESWWITPPINLTGASNPIFSMSSAAKFTGDDIEIYTSTDYDGSSNPNTQGTWNLINAPISTGNNYDWVNTGEVAVTNTSSTTYFAIKYVGTASDGKTWRIDSIFVAEAGTPFSPTITIPEVSVYDIQFTTATPAASPYEGQFVKTGGIVVYAEAQPGPFYMKSGDGPYSTVYVYQTSSGTSVQPGDSVIFSAEVQEYNGLTELAFPDCLEIVGSEFFITPTVPTADAGTEAYESAIINVCGQATSTSGLPSYFDLNDGSGDVEINSYKLGNVFPITITSGSWYNVKGVVNAYYNTSTSTEYYSLRPLNNSNIQSAATNCVNIVEGNELVQFSLYPNPAETNITIDVDGTHLLTITDLSGKVITKKMITGVTSIPVNEFVSGVYFFSLDGNVSKVIVK